MDQTLNAELKLGKSRGRPTCPFSLDAIRGQLQKILASRTFRAAQGQRKFVAYTVEEVLAGRAHLLKEYAIATEAFGRDASFDPRLDPIVRTEARKLRARLAKYYETEGAGDHLRIELRKGSYIPCFHRAVEQTLESPVITKDVEISSIPPAAEALAVGIGFHIEAGQIVMRFSDHVEWVRMSSAGARKLAAMLIERANEQDRLGSPGKSR